MPRRQLWCGGPTKRCNQCWQVKQLAAFTGPIRNRVYQDCSLCRANYGKGVPDHRTGLPDISPLRVTVVHRSGNRKTGPIPEVYVTASTCPRSCPYYNAGCYGEAHLTRNHWRAVERYGVPWTSLVDYVQRLPPKQLWRYGVVGDLPGGNETVDGYSLTELILANRGKRGFGYSHKRTPEAVDWILTAQREGLMISFSADNLQEADEFAARGATVVTLPLGAPVEQKTPEGRVVRVCPAQRGSTTCDRCGLCALGVGKRPIIGFIAHGLRRRLVSERARRLLVVA